MGNTLKTECYPITFNPLFQNMTNGYSLDICIQIVLLAQVAIFLLLRLRLFYLLYEVVLLNHSSCIFLFFLPYCHHLHVLLFPKKMGYVRKFVSKRSFIVLSRVLKLAILLPVIARTIQELQTCLLNQNSIVALELEIFLVKNSFCCNPSYIAYELFFTTILF